MKRNLLQFILVSSMHVMAIRWADEADANGPIDMDIYFDRAVIVSYDFTKYRQHWIKEKYEYKNLTDYGWSGIKYPKLLKRGHLNPNIAPGVFVTHHHVLTSYNPFRELIRNKAAREDLYVKILTKRKIVRQGQYEYEMEHGAVSCAHQIIPIKEEDLTRKQWHGANRQHSPLHDLMVMRINEKFKFLDPNPSLYSFGYYWTGYLTNAGPMITPVATHEQYLGHELKFASLGFRNKRHIEKSDRLGTRSYNEQEHVVVNCDQWIPRYWGHFICIRNVDDYDAVGSGAILIHSNQLFGIGSFTLTKGNESILVFTDVRPYHELIFNTCESYW